MTDWQPNTEGIFLRLPEAIYHASPGLSRSMLDALDPTPDGLPAYLNAPWEPKPWKTIGTAVHKLVEDPSNTLDHLVVQPKEIEVDGVMTPWSGEGCKPKIRAQWKANLEADGKCLVTKAEMDQIRGCSEAIAGNKDPEMRDLLQEIFRKGQSEVSCYRWCGVGETQILLRCRIDFVPDEADYLLDIKTTGEFGTTEYEFQKVVYENRIQPIHYLTVWNSLGDRRTGWVYVGCEKKSPWRCRVFRIYQSSDAMRLGRAEWERRLAIYAECVKSGRWPGWPARIQTIDLSESQVRRLDSR